LSCSNPKSSFLAFDFSFLITLGWDGIMITWRWVVCSCVFT
jgi:hypothetical protein